MSKGLLYPVSNTTLPGRCVSSCFSNRLLRAKFLFPSITIILSTIHLSPLPTTSFRRGVSPKPCLSESSADCTHSTSSAHSAKEASKKPPSLWEMPPNTHAHKPQRPDREARAYAYRSPKENSATVIPARKSIITGRLGPRTAPAGSHRTRPGSPR